VAGWVSMIGCVVVVGVAQAVGSSATNNKLIIHLVLRDIFEPPLFIVSIRDPYTEFLRWEFSLRQYIKVFYICSFRFFDSFLTFLF
jgi:hypothetical protein